MTTTQTPISPATEEKLIDRIRALLAKAESTDYPAEAEALTAKAAELMDRYRIDEARVRPPQAGNSKYEHDMTRYKYLRASAALLGAVCKHYGVVVLMARTGNSKYPDLVGAESDIAAALMMFESLILQRDRACLAERVYPGQNKNAVRNAFCYGYAYRIATRLKEIRDAAVLAAKSESDSTALVVYGRYEVVLADLGNPGSRTTNKPKLDPDGFHAGDRAATTADLGGTRLGATGPRALGA